MIFVLQIRIHFRILLILLHRTSPHASPKRQRGDSNPCGQSPMDFESISLAARTHCHMLAFYHCESELRNFKRSCPLVVCNCMVPWHAHVPHCTSYFFTFFCIPVSDIPCILGFQKFKGKLATRTLPSSFMFSFHLKFSLLLTITLSFLKNSFFSKVINPYF
jgi:hypothetical protein